MMIKLTYRQISIISLIFMITLLLGLSFIDSVRTSALPRCPVNRYLGIQCPGCGSMRALHSLMHGRVADSLHYNFMTVFMLPVLLYSMIAGSVRGDDPVFVSRFGMILSYSFVIVTLFFYYQKLHIVNIEGKEA